MGPRGEAFPTTRWTQGYKIDEVDDFMAIISTLSPGEIAKKQFTVVRLGRGYRMDSVDEALDQWAESKRGDSPPG
jgi:DivIVA domain-containing protein